MSVNCNEESGMYAALKGVLSSIPKEDRRFYTRQLMRYISVCIQKTIDWGKYLIGCTMFMQDGFLLKHSTIQWRWYIVVLSFWIPSVLHKCSMTWDNKFALLVVENIN